MLGTPSTPWGWLGSVFWGLFGWFLGLGLGILWKEGVRSVPVKCTIRLLKPYKARIGLLCVRGTLGTPSTPYVRVGVARTHQPHIKGSKFANGP
jgi:hypothetical protein